MKKMTKTLSVILLSVMLATVGMGCGNTTEKAEQKEPQKAATESAVKPSLKFLGTNATFDLAASPVIPILEQFTGYKVEYEALPSSGEEGMTKLLMLTASGTPYDLMDLPPTYVDKLISIKFASALDDKLKNMPNLMKAVPETSKSWNRVQGEDGKKYAIPQLNPSSNYNVNNAIVVRKDLLDSAGVKMPTTPEELYDALKTLKGKYPDMVPLTVDKNYFTNALLNSTDSIISGFGVSKDWVDNNGKIEPVNLTSNYKELVFYLQKLYNEGLLDKDFPTMDKNARLAKFTSGKAVMVQLGIGDGPGFYSAVEKNVPVAKLDYLPILKDKTGKQSVFRAVGLEKATVIPKSAAHPEDAVKWIEAFMANFKEIYIGKEGVEHTFKDGIYAPILPAFASRDSVFWFLPAMDEANGSNYWFARVGKNPETARNYGDVHKLFTPEVTVNPPVFAFSAPNDEASKLSTKLDAYWNDEMIKVVATKMDAAYYDSVVAKWRADGGTRAIEIGNERWKALSKK